MVEIIGTCRYCGKYVKPGSRCKCIKSQQASANHVSVYGRNSADISKEQDEMYKASHKPGIFAKFTAACIVLAVIGLLAGGGYFIFKSFSGKTEDKAVEFLKFEKYQDAINAFADSCQDNDASKYISSYYFEDLIKAQCEDKGQDFNIWCSKQKNDLEKFIKKDQETYGKDLSYSFEIGSKKDIDEFDIKKYKKSYYNDYNYKLEITEACSVTVNFKITGSVKSTEGESEFILVNIENEGWKIYSRS